MNVDKKGMTVETVTQRLTRLGITLPEVNPPAAVYCSGVLEDGWIYTAGQTPKRKGQLQFTGKLGADVTLADGQRAARLCALNCLAIVAQLAGSLDRVKQIVKMTGYINSTPEFSKQPLVMDGASQLLYDLFGNAGAHARSAVGCASLPGGACCEIEMIVKIHDTIN